MSLLLPTWIVVVRPKVQLPSCDHEATSSRIETYMPKTAEEEDKRTWVPKVLWIGCAILGLPRSRFHVM